MIPLGCLSLGHRVVCSPSSLLTWGQKQSSVLGTQGITPSSFFAGSQRLTTALYFFFFYKLPIHSVNFYCLVFRSNYLETLSDTPELLLFLLPFLQSCKPHFFGAPWHCHLVSQKVKSYQLQNFRLKVCHKRCVTQNPSESLFHWIADAKDQIGVAQVLPMFPCWAQFAHLQSGCCAAKISPLSLKSFKRYCPLSSEKPNVLHKAFFAYSC